MKLKDICEDVKPHKQGTYAGVRYSMKSVDAIQQYLEDNDIPNPVNTKKIHTTLLYSRKFLPKFKAQGMLTHPIKATFEKFVVWETTPPDPKQTPWICLVMQLRCPELVNLHKQYMKEHEAEYDYDVYTPHVTLSYNIGDLDIKQLPKFEDTLYITEEYMETLNLDWAATDGVK